MADKGDSEVPILVQPKAEIAEYRTPAGDSENGCSKRCREGNDNGEQNEEKRAKLEDVNSAEERRIESSEHEKAEDEEKEAAGATIGPKTFGSSVEMFDYFFKLLHTWIPYVNLNKYEHKVMLELVEKGHIEAERKIGKGIKHFQVRFHPQFRSRCFFLIREDDFIDDFSFRKCVDHILPLPENMEIKHDARKPFRENGRGYCHGRGRGWK